MRKKTKKSQKAGIWTKTAIITVRAIFLGLASVLALISIYGLKRTGV
ncbi:MAG: hypothetical protein Q7S86_00440 [bacterium]|nr:hypothetical protein [bacterium]